METAAGVGAMCVLKAASMLSRADAPRFRVVHRVAAGCCNARARGLQTPMDLNTE